MANLVATATDFEDLFGDIVSFLSTNVDLVAANQEWEVLRLRRDNLAGITTNMVDTATGANRRIVHTARYDPRTLNINNPTASAEAVYGTVAVTAGTSFVSYQLRQTRTVAKVRYRAATTASGTFTNAALRSFRLQYSDDGSTWTTALTVVNTPAFAVGEWRDFAVPGTPGSHVYWRIIVDAVQSGTNVAWSNLMLLEADDTVANHFGSEAIFKAPGLAGTDEIYTGVRSEYDTTNGWYNLFWNGYTGFDPNEQSWFQQPGALPGYGASEMRCVPMTACWNSPMPYWLVASGRSFRMGVKVSTVYGSAYLGFGLPYAQPDQYPYPLVVAGSLAPAGSTRGPEWRYSVADYFHGSIAGPGSNHGAWTTPPVDQYTTMYMRSVDGSWWGLSNRPTTSSTGSETVVRPDQGGTYPYVPSGNARGVWPHMQFSPSATSDKGRYQYRENLGGGYMLIQCLILSRLPVSAPQMELEGVFWISGYTNAPENTGVFGGKTHVVFQNAYRNTVHEFFALSLD
jgi:hypothetical protein